jgi:hypothetical protein
MGTIQKGNKNIKAIRTTVAIDGPPEVIDNSQLYLLKHGMRSATNAIPC